RAEALGEPLGLARAALALRRLPLVLALQPILQPGDLGVLARDVLERLVEQILERLALVRELPGARRARAQLGLALGELAPLRVELDALLLERLDLRRLRALGRLHLAQAVAHLRELLLDRARAVGRGVARGGRRREVGLRLPGDPARVEAQAAD